MLPPLELVTFSFAFTVLDDHKRELVRVSFRANRSIFDINTYAEQSQWVGGLLS